MKPETDNPYPIGTVCRIRSDVVQPGVCRIGEITSAYQPVVDAEGSTWWGYEIDIYSLAPPASGLPWIARHGQLTPLTPPDPTARTEPSAVPRRDGTPV